MGQTRSINHERKTLQKFVKFSAFCDFNTNPKTGQNG